MSHRALITGVSGFVGGFLVEHLVASGDEVLGTSPDGGWLDATPDSVRRQAEVLAWDLANPAGLPDGSRRRIEQLAPTVIYHLAAMSVPGECGAKEPTPLAVAINVEGTRRVLELARSLEPSPRVLAISSSHVYARHKGDSKRTAEDAPLEPPTAYGATKLRAEEQVRQAIGQGCDAIIARPFPHAGPRQSPLMMLAQWARQLAQPSTDPIEVYTCDATIDVCDVRDVVRAYRLLVERGRTGEVYNVGSGLARRSGDVLTMLRRLAESTRPVVELKPGAKWDPIADLTKLVRDTGWRPEIPLEQTLADTLAWWREQMEPSL